MAKRKCASSVIFGFAFQVNAAIILMLDNVIDLKSLHLEGNYEDIQIELNNGQHILAQAKSVVNSSSDFRNVRKNLKKVLEFLSAGNQEIAVKQLILIKNSPNPLKDDRSKYIFQGPPAYRDFLHCLLLLRQLLDMWHWSVFTNGSKSNANIFLIPKDIMWSIVVIATDISRCDDEFLDRFEPGDYDEIVHRFKNNINFRYERYEFFVKVLADYNCHDISEKPVA